MLDTFSSNQDFAREQFASTRRASQYIHIQSIIIEYIQKMLQWQDFPLLSSHRSSEPT